MRFPPRHHQTVAQLFSATHSNAKSNAYQKFVRSLFHMVICDSEVPRPRHQQHFKSWRRKAG